MPPDPYPTPVGPEDAGTDLEDELDYDDLDYALVSPLPRMISPLPEFDSLQPVSPSQYPAPPLPASLDYVSVTPLPPMLPLPLLPLPDGGTLSMDPVVSPAPDDSILPSEQSVSASPDMSLEGLFDARQSASVSGAATLVLDNLPGCQYRMTSYDSADAADVDPAFGLQLHHPRFLEFVGVPELARLLTRPRDTGSATWTTMRPCRRPSSCSKMLD